jgi:hypothetical protein
VKFVRSETGTAVTAFLKSKFLNFQNIPACILLKQNTTTEEAMALVQIALLRAAQCGRETWEAHKQRSSAKADWSIYVLEWLFAPEPQRKAFCCYGASIIDQLKLLRSYTRQRPLFYAG